MNWRDDEDFRAYLETKPITMAGFHAEEVDMVHQIAHEAWTRGRAEVSAWLRALADESERRATSPDGTVRDLLGGTGRAATCRQLAEALDKRVPLHGIAVGKIPKP